MFSVFLKLQIQDKCGVGAMVVKGNWALAHEYAWCPLHILYLALSLLIGRTDILAFPKQA